MATCPNCGNAIVSDSDGSFDALWADYPRRIGRKMALRHFRASVHTAEDRTLIRAALDRYLVEVHDRPLRYVQHGSTWFGQWQDWIDAPLAVDGPSLVGAGLPTKVTRDDVAEIEAELRFGWNHSEIPRAIGEAWVSAIRSDYVRDGLLVPDAPTLTEFYAARRVG